MEDVSKRVSILEMLMAEIRAILPTLATKEELQSVRTEVQTVRTEVQSVRTEIQAVRGELKSEIHAVETRLIKWFVGTAITLTAASFTAAKLVS